MLAHIVEGDKAESGAQDKQGNDKLKGKSPEDWAPSDFVGMVGNDDRNNDVEYNSSFMFEISLGNFDDIIT